MTDHQAQILGGMMFLSMILHLVQIHSLIRIRARLRHRALFGARPTSLTSEPV